MHPPLQESYPRYNYARATHWISSVVIAYTGGNVYCADEYTPCRAPGAQGFLADHPRLVVLTGAGVSATSGIPTYRDRRGIWRHADPVTHQEYVAEPARRQRYWARSMRGWPAVRDARPNRAHLALAQLERMGHINLLITQNVDRLHQRAGSKAVVDLHGRVDKVRCMACAATFAREHIQHTLERTNPAQGQTRHDSRPDGDADIPDELVASFISPVCEQCGGTLIPDVVFFGGSVPPARVERCTEAIAAADALLVVVAPYRCIRAFGSAGWRRSWVSPWRSSTRARPGPIPWPA